MTVNDFFRKSKIEIDTLKNRIYSLEKAIKSLNEEKCKNERYIDSFEGFLSMIKKFKALGINLPFYVVESEAYCNVFYIYVKAYSAHSECGYGVKEITFESCLCRKIGHDIITRCDVSIKQIINREENIICNSMDILNIDTLRMPKQGHASRMLEYVVDYAREHDCTRVRGRIWENSMIKLDDLKSFYSKNGFSVEGNIFFKDLPLLNTYIVT